MIKITQSLNENGVYVIDQSVENIFDQLKNNVDPLTVEFAEDVFKIIIMPKMMENFGYKKLIGKNLYTKNET